MLLARVTSTRITLITLTLMCHTPRFDVILIDPPWEEYVRRAPGFVEDAEVWPWEEIQALDIDAIADTPSVLFL